MITPRPSTHASFLSNQRMQPTIASQKSQTMPRHQRTTSSAQAHQLPNYYRPQQPLQQVQLPQSSHLYSSYANRTLPSFFKQQYPSNMENCITERPAVQKQQVDHHRYQQALDHINHLTLANSKLQEHLQHQRSSEAHSEQPELQRLQLVNQELRVANLGYMKRLQNMERQVGCGRQEGCPTQTPLQQKIALNIANENTPPPHNRRTEISSVNQSVDHTPSSRSSRGRSHTETSPFVLGDITGMKDVQYVNDFIAPNQQQWYVRMDRQITGLKELLSDRNNERRRLETLLEHSKAQEVILTRKVVGLEALVDLLNGRTKQQEQTLNTKQMTIRSLSCRKAPTTRLKELENYKHKFDELSEKSERACSQTRILEEKVEHYKDIISRLEALVENAENKLTEKDDLLSRELGVYKQNERVMLERMQTLTDRLLGEHNNFVEALEVLKKPVEATDMESQTVKQVALTLQNTRLQQSIISLENQIVKLTLQANLAKKESRECESAVIIDYYSPDVLVTPEKSDQRQLQLPLSTIQEQLSNDHQGSAQTSIQKQAEPPVDTPPNREGAYQLLRSEKTQLEESLQRVETEKNEWHEKYNALLMAYLKLKGENTDRKSSESEGFVELSEQQVVTWEEHQTVVKELDQLKFKYSLDMNHVKRERDGYLAELTDLMAEVEHLRSMHNDSVPSVEQ